MGKKPAANNVPVSADYNRNTGCSSFDSLVFPALENTIRRSGKHGRQDGNRGFDPTGERQKTLGVVENHEKKTWPSRKR